MEHHRKGRKRQASPAVKWSFSPIGKHSLRHSSPASPSKARQLAEKENQLQELTQMRAERSGGGPSELLKFWKSPKISRYRDSTTASHPCSSLDGSPTRGRLSADAAGLGDGGRSIEMTLPTFESDPPSMIHDLEDWGQPGSSFFSEADLLEPAENNGDAQEKETFCFFNSVELIIKEVIQDDSRGQTHLICCLPDKDSGGVDHRKHLYLRGLLRDCPYTLDGSVLGANSIVISGGEEPPIYLCYNPRHMIPVTTIADGVSCLRRAVLTSRMQAGCTFNRPSVHLVAGSVVHDVFEAVISDMRKLQNLASLIADSVRRNLLAVYAAGEDEGSVTGHISTMLQSFPSWCQAFLRNDVASTAPAATPQVIDEARASKLGLFEDRRMCLPQVFGLEESISVPNFGIKGKLDAVVLARFRSKRGGDNVEGYDHGAGDDRAQHDSTASASLMVPLELKTGKSLSSASHRAQTLLYTLMLSQRYGLPVPFGLLYYVASGSMLRIVATPLELQALLMIRNRIAAAALSGRKGGLIPAPIKNAHLCRQCPQLENCAVLVRLQPGGGRGDWEASAERCGDARDDGELNGAILSQVRQVGSGARLDIEGQFYEKWEQLIRLEEELVLETKDRPSSGLRAVVLTGCQSASDDCPSSFGRYIAEFSICGGENDQPAASSADSIEFSEGDPVIIYHHHQQQQQRQSGEGGPLDEAAIGFLIKTEEGGHLTVSCDRHIGRHLVRAPGFDLHRAHLWGEVSRVGCRFLMRRDEMLAGFTYARSNLVRLFAPQSSSLRHLLVNLREPKFDSQKEDFSEPQPILAGLDLGQQAAIRHCMAAQDYALMLGMPGTGKTTTLVTLIRLLIQRGASVLVASYTHSAVDNVLTKLQDCGVGVLRLGNADRVDRRLHPCLMHPQNFACTTALREALSTRRVVGTSCLGANHAILASGYPFDYCIVDEAAQITVPVIIGPLLLARRFILVGDHYQLPPLVRSKRALDLGLDVSLFKILAEAHPSAVATLRRQYRMNEDVQLVANRIVYGGLLECASEAVAQGCLDLDRGRLGDFASSWLGRVLDPASRVLFLDTDTLGAPETAIGGSYGNYGEAAIIKLLVTTLTEYFSIEPSRIGVITAFRPQVRIIREACGSRHASLEVSTVDKYQGRDKDCIILSFVRSNAESTIGMILQDWHRLNVAFTRARGKLLMVGSWSTLMRHPVLAPLRELLTEEDWHMFIPATALDQ